MRFSSAVADGIQSLDEHWDGGGNPVGLKSANIPINSRIALLAQVVDVFQTASGIEAAQREAVRGAGGWFDPRLAAAFARVAARPAFWETLRSEHLQQEIFAFEPAQRSAFVDEDYLDDIAARSPR